VQGSGRAGQGSMLLHRRQAAARRWRVVSPGRECSTAWGSCCPEALGECMRSAPTMAVAGHNGHATAFAPVTSAAAAPAAVATAAAAAAAVVAQKRPDETQCVLVVYWDIPCIHMLTVVPADTCHRLPGGCRLRVSRSGRWCSWPTCCQARLRRRWPTFHPCR
jgi:hypothetical protein